MKTECPNLNILAVDDESGIRALYSRALGRRDKRSDFDSNGVPGPDKQNFWSYPATSFNLHIASSGTEAIELVNSLYQQGIRIAAGFFDVRMPGGMDGIEAIRCIRAIDPQILCTVVTAYGEDRLQEINEIFAPDHLDEWDYLNKPFNVGEIIQKARNTVSSWNHRRAEEGHLSEIRRVMGELEDLNQSLDRRVQARTKEFEIANLELESVLKQLRVTQAQLIHTAKMTSLGQLAAGIAHEINNPIGFIQSNLTTGQRYAERLSAYVRQLEKMIANDPDQKEAANNIKSAAKIDFIISDFPGVLAESNFGIARVQQIVNDLRTFSQVDQAGEGASDLNEMLRSAVNLISGELKPGQTLTTNYGALPPVPVPSLELGQVFMNILLNAVQATPDSGEISVITRHVGDNVEVEIKDTGCGIEPTNLERIFEPFFTTKEVGSGIGLGLTVAYNIIKNYGGNLFARSQVGVGTTFTACLPSA